MELRKLDRVMIARNKINKNLHGIYEVVCSETIIQKIRIYRGSIVFFKNGELHRSDGPAIIRKAQDSVSEFYFFNGEEYRKDGPTSINWYYNRVKISLEYQIEVLEQYKDKESWRRICYTKDGNLHNLTKEAVNEPNRSPKKKYYIHGCLYTKKQWESHPLVVAERTRDLLKKKLNNL